MATRVPEERGTFWPIAFGLLGCINLADYAYKFSFQPDDLLKGVGFLLMIPLAYRYPSAFTLNPDPGRPRPASWTRWLSFAGVALVLAGFALEWF